MCVGGELVNRDCVCVHNIYYACVHVCMGMRACVYVRWDPESTTVSTMSFLTWQ